MAVAGLPCDTELVTVESEPLSPILIIGDEAAHDRPECSRVIELAVVGQLVGQYILLYPHRCDDESLVQAVEDD